MVGLWCFIDTFLNTDDLDQLAESTLIGKYYLGCYAADIKPPNKLKTVVGFGTQTRTVKAVHIG
jgi:hypothetical protein